MGEFDLSVAPVVRFDTPINQLQVLAAERDRLRGVIEDISRASNDVAQYDKDAAHYAAIAAAWAAVLMTTDILKISMSAMDRRARFLFDKIDERTATANKLLKVLGLPTITTRDDLMKNVDPSVRSVTDLVDKVKEVRAELKRQKIKVPKNADLMFDLTTAVVEDAALIVSAGRAAEGVHKHAVHAQVAMKEQMARLSVRLRAVEAELTRWVEEAQRRQHIA